MRVLWITPCVLALCLSGLSLPSNSAPAKSGAKKSKAKSGPKKTLAAFRAIRKEMTHRQVEALVGKPDEITGSGLYIEVYQLPDKSSVWVGWTGPMETAQLVYVKHRSKSGDKELLAS